MGKKDNQDGMLSMKIIMGTCEEGGQSGRQVVNEDDHEDVWGRRTIRRAGGQ